MSLSDNSWNDPNVESDKQTSSDDQKYTSHEKLRYCGYT